MTKHKQPGASAYPLAWPSGWPRTSDAERRKTSAFKVDANKCRRDLAEQLRMLGAENVVVSSNVPVRADGNPYADAARRIISDPGVALYFTIDGRQLSMARDQYWRVEDNLRSITLAIGAIRALERQGGSYMMERAFAGFTALPPPKSCWDILGVHAGASETEILASYRAKARSAHPDVDGGSTAAMAELNRARDEAIQAIS